MTYTEYDKIEVLLRDKNGSINKLTFNKCNLKFQSNFIIIIIKDENNNKICNVYDLNHIKSYKLYLN